MTVKIPAKRRTRRPIPEFRVINPGKGLNTLISDSLIKDEEASDLNNIQFVESGAVSKRYGHSQVGDTLTANPKGLGRIYTTTVRQLLTVDGTSLKYLNGSTWDAIAGKTFTTGKEVTFTQARDAVYIWNGFDAPGKYDGSTLSTPTTMPSAAFAIFYSGYHIAAGTDTNTSRLYVSTSANADDFTNDPTGITSSTDPDNVTDVPGATSFTGTTAPFAQFIDVAKGDGDKITGLAKFGTALIIFKELSTYQLTFDSSGLPTVSQISSSVGCVSHKSIDNVENDVFFLSRGGYYVLGNEPNYTANAIRTNELSARIHPTVETITASNLPKTASIYSDFTFYSSVAAGGTTSNNALITYNRRFTAWSVSDNVNANAFTEFVDSSNVKHLYYAADDEAKVFEIDTNFSDDGEAIDAFWVGKAHDGGNFDVYKHFIDITLLFRQVTGSVDIKVIADGSQILATTQISNANDLTGTIGYSGIGDGWIGGDISTMVSTNTAAGTANVPYRLDINKDARSAKVKVANANNNENFTLLGYVITYRPYSHYQFPSAQRLSGSVTTTTTPPAGAIVTEEGEIIITE